MKLPTVSLISLMLLVIFVMESVIAGRNHRRQDSRSVSKTDLNYFPQFSFDNNAKVKTWERKLRGHSRKPIKPTLVGCPTCPKAGLKEKEIQQIAIERFVEKLAEKLRTTPEKLRSGPRMKSPILPPEVIQETLDKNREMADGDYLGNVKVVIPSKDLGKKNCYAKKRSRCYSFDIEGEVEGRVKSAELWVHKMAGIEDETRHTYVVYGLEKSKIHNIYKSRYQLHRVKTTIHEGWVVIDVTSTVADWVSQGISLGNIAVRCETCLMGIKPIILNRKEESNPLLYVEYHPKSRHSRSRRSSNSPSCNPQTSCCKRRLNVDLHAIHMYEVVVPNNLEIGYCTGTCDMYGMQYGSNNTLLVQRERYNTPELSSYTIQGMSPCCVPISYFDVTMQLHGGSGTTLELFSDLVVRECGCL